MLILNHQIWNPTRFSTRPVWLIWWSEMTLIIFNTHLLITISTSLSNLIRGKLYSSIFSTLVVKLLSNRLMFISIVMENGRLFLLITLKIQRNIIIIRKLMILIYKTIIPMLSKIKYYFKHRRILKICRYSNFSINLNCLIK